MRVDLIWLKKNNILQNFNILTCTIFSWIALIRQVEGLPLKALALNN